MGHTEYTEEKGSGPKVISAGEIKKEVYPGVNRNDPCPCGSGKKFKQCH